MNDEAAHSEASGRSVIKRSALFNRSRLFCHRSLSSVCWIVHYILYFTVFFISSAHVCRGSSLWICSMYQTWHCVLSATCRDPMTRVPIKHVKYPGTTTKHSGSDSDPVHVAIRALRSSSKPRRSSHGVIQSTLFTTVSVSFKIDIVAPGWSELPDLI